MPAPEAFSLPASRASIREGTVAEDEKHPGRIAQVEDLIQQITDSGPPAGQMPVVVEGPPDQNHGHPVRGQLPDPGAEEQGAVLQGGHFHQNLRGFCFR